jgi:hypothetical protein
MIPAAQLVAMVVGGVNGEPGWGRYGLTGFFASAGKMEGDYGRSSV